MIGVITHKESARSSTQYRKAKSVVAGATEDDVRREKSKSKEEHARAWIEYMGALFAEVGYGENNTHKRYLPYDSFTELFAEYEHYHRFENKDIRNVQDKVTGSKETFRKAFQSLKDKIKLRTAKGSFETCSVCNNLNDCLKNTSGEWTRVQIDLILRLKRLHLLQQSQERLDSNLRKMDALHSTDKDGNPKALYIEADGFTEFKTRTPIQGKGRKSKGDTKKIGNRVIGVVVACGPVDTRFVYSLNDLIRGGANIMVEVVRQTIYDVSRILATYNLATPKQVYLQFDNCGENKVSTS